MYGGQVKFKRQFGGKAGLSPGLQLPSWAPPASFQVPPAQVGVGDDKVLIAFSLEWP